MTIDQLIEKILVEHPSVKRLNLTQMRKLDVLYQGKVLKHPAMIGQYFDSDAGPMSYFASPIQKKSESKPPAKKIEE